MAAMLVLASPGYATVVRAPSPPASSVPSSLRSRSTTVSPLRSGDAATQAWPLFLGPEVGVIAEEGTTTGCTTVYRTKDFSHWRDITPPQVAPPEGPQPRGGCLYIWQSASFVSADDGWVLGRDGGGTDTVLFHTLDGGRTWSREPGGATGSNAGGEAIGFANADFGWRQQFATGSNGPYTLEVTRDAGASWSLLPSVDAHGGCEFAPVVFADPRVAFAAEPMTDAAGGLFAPWVWRSTNGGASWSHMALARPAWLKGTSAFYGQPRFFAATGVLPVLFTERSSTWLGFYRSTDWGLSWHLQAVVATQSGLKAGAAGTGWCEIPTAAGSPPAVAIAGPRTWWVVASRPGSWAVSVTKNAGVSWASSTLGGAATSPSEHNASVTYFQASGGARAWMTLNLGVPVQTDDGGRTWSRLEPST